MFPDAIETIYQLVPFLFYLCNNYEKVPLYNNNIPVNSVRVH